MLPIPLTLAAALAAQPLLALAETCPIHRIADQNEDRSFARGPARGRELGLQVS